MFYVFFNKVVLDHHLTDDPTQRACALKIDAFIDQQRFFKKLFSKGPDGLYLYGGVGSGKTTLMNAMASYIGEKGARFHMKAFMLMVHQKGIKAVIASLKKIRYLFLDELEITDIADAMMIQRLFSALIQNRIAIVTTSNIPIALLYENGFHYDRFQPFLSFMHAHFMALHFDQGIDYRHAHQNQVSLNFQANTATHLWVLDKKLPVVMVGDGAFSILFSDICDQPLGPVHYQCLSALLDVLYITETPVFKAEHANSLRRLITLVDLMYDGQKRVILLPESLVMVDDTVQLPVKRLMSRLYEMRENNNSSI
ncbi:MAG: Cell division protein ZapE [Holosporales bacterium]